MKHAFGTQLALLEERPSYLAGRRFDARAFGGHPYANPPYGTKESIAAFTSEDVREFITRRLARGRLLIVASGDVDGALLSTMLSPIVADVPEEAPPPARAIAMQGAGETLHETRSLPQTLILFGAPGVAREDERFYAAYLLDHILGGDSLASRFADTLRQRDGLVYGIGTGLDIREGTALLRGQLATRNETAAQALDAVKKELSKMQAEGVTARECADAKTYITGAFARELDSTLAVSDLLLAMRRYTLGRDYITTRADYFNAVRCDAINRVARELLDPARFLFVTVGKETK
jgi:zinc protease